MKIIMILLAIGKASSSSSTQKIGEGMVPNKVKTSFQKPYPEPEEVKWDKEDNDY